MSGSGPRPERVVLVTGTGTDIGKTWVSCRLAERLRASGVSVAARKPAQSFAPGDDDAGRTDAQQLGAATGEDPFVVCPRERWYPVPMAPPMAADALGRPPPSIVELGALDWPAPVVPVGLVETAGGVRSPLGADGDAIDLGRLIAPDLALLVADAGLGTINAVVLSMAALAELAVPVAVHLNRFDPADDLHVRNAEWLCTRTNGSVFTVIDDLAAVVLRPPG